MTYLFAVRAELVEAPYFSSKEGQGFDKLSPNGSVQSEVLA